MRSTKPFASSYVIDIVYKFVNNVYYTLQKSMNVRVTPVKMVPVVMMRSTSTHALVWTDLMAQNVK